MEDLKVECNNIREKIALYAYESGRGHVSSALSAVEIYASLYFYYLDVGKIKNHEPDRDYFVLSKGHGALGLYVTLASVGIVSFDDIKNFATINGKVSTHPVKDSLLGVEMTAGSLGQGLSFACGVAKSSKVKGYNNKIVVMTGDGELQEGSNWEAILFAAQHKLDNLTLIVDENKKQITGNVEDIISINPIGKKLEAFGFEVISVNGHNITEIVNALNKKVNNKPKAIIASTVKGKGFSFMENADGWHGKGLNEEQYNIVMQELNKEMGNK